ncbi:MAG: hypothetical protein WCL39_03995, partial [Armatimonadota bacterium]
MKKVRFVTFLVMLCLAASIASQAANVIVNGDFASAVTLPGAKTQNLWYSTGDMVRVPLTTATGVAVFTAGPGCSFLGSNGYMNTLRYWAGVGTVSPGRTYTFSFQYKATGSGFALGGPNTSGDTSTCQLQEIAYSGLSTIVNAPNYGSFNPITTATGDNWTTYSKTFTTEAGVDNLIFKMNVAMGLGNDAALPGHSASYIHDVLQMDNFQLIAHPLVVITSPTSNSSYETTASTVNIAGTATSDSALTSVTWSNSAGGSGTCTGTTSWSKTGIALVNGDNIITVSTTNADGKTGTDMILVSKIVPLPIGPVITDNFNRTAGTTASLGSTDAPNVYPWTRGGYATHPVDPYTWIDGSKMVSATGPNDLYGVFIDSLVMRDFDATITMSVPGAPSGGGWWNAGWTGIQYRGMKPMFTSNEADNNGVADPAAYLIEFTSGSQAGIYTGHFLTGAGEIQSFDSGVNFGTPHVVRLKVVGSRHRVWIDNILDTDTPKLDVVNTSNLGAGYFEVCRRDFPMTYDDLQIKLHDEYGTVSGTVRNASTNAVIPGAEVTVLGKTATTGVGGTYSLTGLVTGSWPMSVVADG